MIFLCVYIPHFVVIYIFSLFLRFVFMGTIFKVFWLCHNTVSVLCLDFFGLEACEILAPWPGIEPIPPALEGKVLTPPTLKGKVLTPGPPWKSLYTFSEKKKNSFFKRFFWRNAQFPNPETINSSLPPDVFGYVNAYDIRDPGDLKMQTTQHRVYVTLVFIIKDKIHTEYQ